MATSKNWFCNENERKKQGRGGGKNTPQAMQGMGEERFFPTTKCLLFAAVRNKKQFLEVA